uniref:Integrator complex subunit 1 n=1 Tax=Aceria tosichella TaxID=561515 RepID=A0A6G1SH60_9ACAR
MSELDKKLQKNPPDLVQSVLEAIEKRSVERVDMLITNAFRQLKTTRFKPDQTICISLTYLARVCPKAFSQSANLKELLKTHIKRDSGPTNIKGTKNDFIVPVLAANILLACCDSADVRSIILARIEQWIGSNQKLNEQVQHLLAVLCVRCHDDPQTIKTLIEIRSHWYQFLDTNYATYGPVSKDLSRSIRNLLSDAISCESLTENLYFLAKHDADIVGLTTSISKLIIRQPLTVESMFDHTELGEQLKQMLVSLYDKLFEQFNPAIKKDELDSPVFIKISSPTEGVVAVDRSVIEALLILVSSPQLAANLEVPGPVVQWLREQPKSPFKLAHSDVALTQPVEVPTRLLQRMIRSNDLQVDLALKCAKPIQLLEMIQSFGLEVETLRRIFERMDSVDTDDIIKSGIKDLPFFNELMDFYDEMGVKEAHRLSDFESKWSTGGELKPNLPIKMETVEVRVESHGETLA